MRSADFAQEQGEKYLAHTMRAAIRNYHLDTPGNFPNIKGYEHYENMVLAPEAIEPYVAEFAKGAVTGTPQMILERMWELKEQFNPQGFFPHVYYGGMPQDEARRTCICSPRRCCPSSRAGKPTPRSTTASWRRRSSNCLTGPRTLKARG